MKQLIIQTNDAMAYIAFALVAIVAVVCLLSGKVGTGLIILGGGWVACSLIFGLWFVLSDMADSLRKIAGKK